MIKRAGSFSEVARQGESESMYEMVLSSAMKSRGLDLRAAYELFCQQIEEANAVTADPDKAKHLAEARKAFESLKAKQS